MIVVRQPHQNKGGLSKWIQIVYQIQNVIANIILFLHQNFVERSHMDSESKTLQTY